VCVCVCEAPLPLLYRGLAWSVGGYSSNPPPHRQPPFMSEPPQQSGARPQSAGRDRAPSTPMPGVAWPSLRFALWAALWAYASVLMWVGPGLFSSWFFPFFDNCAFPSGTISILSTCIWCKFLQSDNSSSTSGIRLVANVYVCRNM
jgi:hypothetical protein